MLKSTKKLPFEGCATALVTPFKNGEIDLDAFSRLVEVQIKAGVGALVVCGTTGEAPTLTETERQKLICRAAEISAGRVPVIAGTGGPCTDKMLRMSWRAREAGADAFLIVNPYYNKGTEEGIVRSFYAAASLGPPVILYNVPGRTGSDMSISLIARLSEHGNIVAIKEASSISKASEILASPKCDLHVYCGNDGDTLPSLALGARGVISVVSNIFPELWVRLCAEYENGNTAVSRDIQLMSLPFIRALFAETSPCPVKYLCERTGICLSDVRLPLGDISEELKKVLVSEYERVHSAQKELEKDEKSK